MGESWVVLELSSRSDQEDPDVIKAAIVRSLKRAEVFIPAAVTQIGDDRSVHVLMEGYAFVRLDRAPQDYFKLENTKYVQAVLALPGANGRHRKLSVVDDSAIEKMREQIRLLVDQGISIGDIVRITSGPYRNMQAIVVEEIPEEGKVQVHIKLRSKQSLVALPRSFLVVVERAPLSTVSGRINALLDWATAAYPVVKWTASLEPLEKLYGQYARVETLLQKLALLIEVRIFDTTYPKELAEFSKMAQTIEKLRQWETRTRLLESFIGFYQGVPSGDALGAAHGKVADLLWIDEVLGKIRSLWEDVESISRALAHRQEKEMIENVIVDGHNLACRCAYAPGISSLMDSQGRPTGVIIGFLRSLGSLKKRYPDAVLYVTWDGSSKRRRARFSEYKAQRNSNPPDIRVLKEILPLVGVRQAWNPDEEADDVIATLTRRDLAKQRNVMFSTDKDLLQLVNDETSLLIPPVGSRNEILFDPATVLEAVGVAPSKMVQLRAFYGDTSDNIPGVPRVPKKVLRSLVQAHGSVEAVYRSGLTGLTKGQYERLRSAEPQVKINVELMSLVDVGVEITPPDMDPNAAAAILTEYDIQPGSLLETFFRRSL